MAIAQRMVGSSATRCQTRTQAFSSAKAPRTAMLVCRASSQQQDNQLGFAQKAAALASAAVLSLGGPAAYAADAPVTGLCDASCVSKLDTIQTVTTASGLQYKDITVGTGPSPIVGYQVVANYVAMTEQGRIFENSLEKTPFDVRVGAGQMIPGLDEGMLSMKVGGVRRLYIPGSLAFPKPLKAAAGRPSVPANSPVVFDVQLLYIPGLDDE